MTPPGENKEGRAGRYVAQPTGYRAFTPTPLPPEPPLDLGGHLRDLLSEADGCKPVLGRLRNANVFSRVMSFVIAGTKRFGTTMTV